MKREAWQAWVIGAALPTLSLRIRMATLGVVPVDNPPEAKTLGALRMATLQLFDLIDNAAKDLGIQCLQPSPAEVQNKLRGIPQDRLLTPEQASDLDVSAAWRLQLHSLMWTRSVRAFGAFALACQLGAEHLLLQVYDRMGGTAAPGECRFLGEGYQPIQLTSFDQQMVAAVFGAGHVKLIEDSLDRWRDFQRTAAENAHRDPTFLAQNWKDINAAADRQFLAWLSLILGEKKPRDFLSRAQRVGLDLIPIAIIALGLSVAIWLLALFLPGISASASTAVELTISGGLVAAALNLLRLPIRGLSKIAQRSAIRRTFLTLPKCASVLRSSLGA